jgi:SAM-dependent methyltransferase
MDICRICGNSEGNASLAAREMMFGTREEFRYFSCSRCGCLQIADIPTDLSRHYPSDYYSYDPPRLSKARLRWLRKFLKRARLRMALSEKESLIGRRVLARYPAPGYLHLTTWFRPAGVKPGDAILEVGCGQGAFLVDLSAEGFRRLTGVDPFVERDLEYPGGVRVLKRRLDEVEGRFDFAMIHHAFEHVPDPLGALTDFRRLMAPGRFLLVRIPVASAAWEEYGVDWVQLDAPRHLHLHTEKSMALLAAQAGFQIRDVAYDSGDFQFWGSEQYRMGIPLMDPRSHAVDRSRSPFTPAQLSAFGDRAAEWNRDRRGDQACFFLQVL